MNERIAVSCSELPRQITNKIHPNVHAHQSVNYVSCSILNSLFWIANYDIKWNLNYFITNTSETRNFKVILIQQFQAFLLKLDNT